MFTLKSALLRQRKKIGSRSYTNSIPKDLFPKKILSDIDICQHQLSLANHLSSITTQNRFLLNARGSKSPKKVLTLSPYEFKRSQSQDKILSEDPNLRIYNLDQGEDFKDLERILALSELETYEFLNTGRPLSSREEIESIKIEDLTFKTDNLRQELCRLEKESLEEFGNFISEFKDFTERTEPGYDTSFTLFSEDKAKFFATMSAESTERLRKLFSSVGMKIWLHRGSFLTRRFTYTEDREKISKPYQILDTILLHKLKDGESLKDCYDLAEKVSESNSEPDKFALQTNLSFLFLKDDGGIFDMLGNQAIKSKMRFGVPLEDEVLKDTFYKDHERWEATRIHLKKEKESKQVEPLGVILDSSVMDEIKLLIFAKFLRANLILANGEIMDPNLRKNGNNEFKTYLEKWLTYSFTFRPFRLSKKLVEMDPFWRGKQSFKFGTDFASHSVPKDGVSNIEFKNYSNTNRKERHRELILSLTPLVIMINSFYSEFVDETFNMSYLAALERGSYDRLDFVIKKIAGVFVKLLDLEEMDEKHKETINAIGLKKYQAQVTLVLENQFYQARDELSLLINICENFDFHLIGRDGFAGVTLDRKFFEFLRHKKMVREDVFPLVVRYILSRDSTSNQQFLNNLDSLRGSSEAYSEDIFLSTGRISNPYQNFAQDFERLNEKREKRTKEKNRAEPQDTSSPDFEERLDYVEKKLRRIRLLKILISAAFLGSTVLSCLYLYENSQVEENGFKAFFFKHRKIFLTALALLILVAFIRAWR